MKAASLRVLFVLRVLCLVTLAGGQPKAPLKCSVVCRHFTSRLAEKKIMSYRRTEPQCTKQAILFITQKSLEICADPDAEWVKKIVEKLDQKKAAASSLPRDAASGAAPEELPSSFQKHVGVTAPSQGTAPAERIHIPAARTEVASRSPPAVQDTTQLPAETSPVIQEVAACPEVTPEANRYSLKSPTPSTTSTAGMVSGQPTPHPGVIVYGGVDNTVGSTEEPVGHTSYAVADVEDMTSPSSNSHPMATTKVPDHPILSTIELLDSTSARTNTPEAASNSFNSDLPSILDSKEITTVPATPVPPETPSVSAPNSTTAIDKRPSVHNNKVISSSADAFGARTFDYSSPVGKQEPSDMLLFTSQAFSGQARVQMATERPNSAPLPSFLSRSQMHFVIPVSVVGGLMVCSVAVVWLYLKFGLKPEEASREMVQGRCSARPRRMVVVLLGLVNTPFTLAGDRRAGLTFQTEVMKITSD